MNPTCKNINCDNEITIKTQSGKFYKFCSDSCRYAAPRGGKQYSEQPPICFLEECQNSVSWHSAGRVWGKYCCIVCSQKGKSLEISRTKLENHSLKPKIERRTLMKCSVNECNNHAFLRRKKGTVFAYCSNKCRNIGRVINQNKSNNLRFGVDRPSQNSEIFEKAEKNGKRIRSYIFKSGINVMVRGYEPKALALLESSGYTEHDIFVSSKDMPKIWYIQAGKKHRYHPDIYIPNENLIIEVKSTWTYDKYKEKNILKRQACLDAGYSFRFMVFDGKGKLLEDYDK